MAAALQQPGGELMDRKEAPPGADSSASDEQSTRSIVSESMTEGKDKDLPVDPEKVKAPGLMERAKEEVEAMAEAMQEKLELKSSDEQSTPAETKKDEQAGLFKRLMKKFGFSKN